MTPPPPNRNSTKSTMLLVLLVSTLLFTINPPYTDATKHTFQARGDRRIFIGPIGPPFGFFKDGKYDLKISNFELKLKDHHLSSSSKGNKKTIAKQEAEKQNEYLKKLHPGFLLKRFKNENDFANFQESIYYNLTKCGFEDFIHGGTYALDDDDSINMDAAPASLTDQQYADDQSSSDSNDFIDEYLAKGKGVIDGGQDGIFLSMKNQENMWYKNEGTLKHRFTEGEAGFYFLFYQICLPEGNDDISKFIFKEVKSKFKLDFEYTNVDSLGRVTYLTAGDMPLPHIYFYFTISYLILLVMWLQSMKRDEKNNGRKPTIYAIHHLMSSVVFLKVLTLLLESIRYHFIRVRGHAEIWSFVYYLANFLRGTFFFIVILLIGSGWSFFKPHLSPNEQKIMLFITALQIIDNIALGMLAFETENERLYNDWSTILHLVDIVSCCALLLPIVWQVNSLEETIDVGSGSDDNATDATTSNDNADEEGGNVGVPVEESTTNAPSSRLQSKLELFRSFYLIVVGYIYFTRIVVYLFESSLGYNQTWIRTFVYEMGTLTFYFVVGIKFKPVDESYTTDYSNVATTEEGNEDMDDVRALLTQKEKNLNQKQVELSNMLSGGKIAKD